MHKPLLTYLVSSPLGDVPVDTDKLHLPLECDPLKTPYRVYFHAIKDFIEHDAYRFLRKAAGKRGRRLVSINEMDEIIIRAEKHGALYHPASIEMILEKNRLKFGLNVAVSETGRDWLKKEFSVIQHIKERRNLPYLPEVYAFDEQSTASFLLEEWLEGYHEFHISMTESGEQVLNLWEFGKGNKYLSSEQSFEIYRQASKILTLYYDMNDFSQIYPWHHAAGDFIAKADGNGIDLRITTARQYDPYMIFREKEQMNPVIALFYFFLNLTVRMRLDKLDGVGDTVWVADFCLKAAIKGFFDGLGLKKGQKDYFGSEKEFLNILKSFSREDLKTAYSPLIDIYKETTDYPVIIDNLDGHVEVLNAILRNCPS
jgi:hypothetical protein